MEELFQKIERYLKKRNLKLDNDTDYAKLYGVDIRQFIVDLVCVLNVKYNTIVPSTGNLQCWRDKNRSFGDIYRIVRFYYPHITVKEVYDEIIVILKNHKKYHIGTSICSTIHKRVYYRSYYSCFYYNPVDEYGMNFKEYAGISGISEQWKPYLVKFKLQ